LNGQKKMTSELAQSVFITPGVMALGVLTILAVLLLVAAWIDLRQQRVPNSLVFSGALLALLLHAALPNGDGFLSSLPGGLGLAGSLTGLACGLLAFLPFYWLRAMGAGDVKLVAMVGAFLGPVDIWPALFFTLIAGGVLVVAVALHRGVLTRVLENLKLILFDLFFALSMRSNPRPGQSRQAFISAAPLPYAVAIAAGSITAGVYRAGLAGLL
jgi:prepilin peptidase CpaA